MVSDLYTWQADPAAITSNDLLLISGHLVSRSDGSTEPEFETQVRPAFAKIEAPLDGAGYGFDDIADVTTSNIDPENQFATVMAIKAEAFTDAPYPSWTTIGVKWLAGFDFEIRVITQVLTAS